jgi:hypothetical protein
MASWLTPHWFHLWFNRRVRGFDDSDIFPTFYGANTRWRLRSLLAEVGFSQIEVTLAEGSPSALEFSHALHKLGKVYERVVGRLDHLAVFRMNLIVVASKERSGLANQVDIQPESSPVLHQRAAQTKF